MLITRAPIFISTLLLGISCHLYAEDIKVNSPEVARWNKFVEDILSQHKRMINNRDIYTKESYGGYGGVTDDLEFYREVMYYDRKTDKLLSNTKWGKNNPNNIHSIDIYIYDDQGRIKRDYSATYLPYHRNAPYQTLINIHHYNKKLHSIRQFDASDEHLSEYCTGTYNGRPVRIAFEDYEIPDSISEISEKSQRAAYLACFDKLTNSAGAYLNPLIN